MMNKRKGLWFFVANFSVTTLLVRRTMEEQSKIAFHCEADAKQALKQWEYDHNLRFHAYTARVEALDEVQRQRGRPKKDAVPQAVTRYRVTFPSVQRKEGAIQAARRKGSRFVLVTTVPPTLHGKTLYWVIDLLAD